MSTSSLTSSNADTNNNPLEIAKRDLLEVSGVDERQLQSVLDRILDYKVDVADLYFQATRHETWSLDLVPSIPATAMSLMETPRPAARPEEMQFSIRGGSRQRGCRAMGYVIKEDFRKQMRFGTVQ